MSTSTELEKALEESPNKVNLFLMGISIGHIGAHTLQHHLETHPQLSILELRGSQIGHQGVLQLTKGLRNHPAIQHIGLARNQCDSGSVVTMIQALATTHVQTLDLEWNALDNGVAIAIAEWLKNPECELAAVSLERNDIRFEGGIALAEALRVNKSLRNLNLAFNRLGTHGATALGETLKTYNDTLLTLNLGSNDIVLEGARGLVEGLIQNRTLRAINLQNNQAFAAFGERGRSMVFNESLKEISLFSNRIYTPQIAKGFGEALQGARNVMGLSLGKSYGGDAAMAPILNGMTFMVSLANLDLSSCTLTSASGPDLSSVLATCTNLQSILLDDNRLEAEGAKAIATGIAHATSLTYLSLGGCSIKSEGLRALASALATRRGLHLRRLILNRNGIDSEGIISLAEALCTYEGLSELDLASNQLSGRCCGALLKILDAHRCMTSVTVRDNVLADLLHTSYVDLDQARTFLTDIDPTGEQTAFSASVKINTSHIGQGAARGATVPTGPPPERNIREMVSNFNQTTSVWRKEAPSVTPNALELLNTTQQRGDLSRHGISQISAIGNTSEVNLDQTSSSRSQTAKMKGHRFLHQSDLVAAPSLSSPSTVVEPPKLRGTHAVSNPTPFSQRRIQLHDYESNISELCISDTQLRLKFAEWDTNCHGYLSVPEFRKLYSSVEVAQLPSDRDRLEKLIVKYGSDNKIFYDEFCIMMLQLVNH